MNKSDTSYTLTGPFNQLLTLRNLPLRGALKDQSLEIFKNSGVVSLNDRIVDLGDFKELKAKYAGRELSIDPVFGPVTAFPGIVDAHTHICYAGTRANDFAARNSGISYLEIAASGGGIWSTVSSTRQASPAILNELLNGRLDRLLSQGTTTVEIKSGYGLDLENELKMLRVIKQAGQLHSMDIVSTCLAAHMLPRDFGSGKREYLQFILDKLLPEIEKEGLARRFDIFVEQSAFDPDIAIPFLQALRKKNFDLTVHGDQFTTGGSRVAVECEALSVDHLEASRDEEIELISKSRVIPVVLPGASIGLGCSFAPARKLLDNGCSLAIASDWNPGSAPQGDILAQAGILASFEKLSSAEVWAGITFRAAAALKISDRGILDRGLLCDMVAFPCNDYREVLYHQGSMKASAVWKRAKRIQ